MTHPIYKYQSIAKQWDAILSEGDSGKLRRPITAEECCRMIQAIPISIVPFESMMQVFNDLRPIREHLEKAKNGT